MATVNTRELTKTLNTLGGPLDRAIKDIATKIEIDARTQWRAKGGNQQSGKYTSAFDTERAVAPAPAKLGTPCWAAYNDDPKANWLEHGTGVHGPYRQPITATPPRPMRFQIAGVWISTYSVQGRKATPTLTTAAEAYADANGHTWEPNTAEAKGNRIRRLP